MLILLINNIIIFKLISFNIKFIILINYIRKLIAFYYNIIKGKLSIYRAQDRRIRVKIKTRLLKEGINRIDNKEA
jgi:hypothetical protein